MDPRLLLLGMAAGLVGFTLPRSQESEALPLYATAAAHASAAGEQPAGATLAYADVVSSEAGGTAALVESALTALSADVKNLSDASALRHAFLAYYSFKAAHQDEVRKPYLYFVDYGLDNRTPRGYVFNMDELDLVEGPFIVAHGRGSSVGKNAVPKRFSNAPGSASTSLGLYVAQEAYGFSGHSGGQLYTSIGLRLAGKSGRFNSAARARGVVVHGAPYVTSTGAGRSEGCPAMEQARARRLIPMIANGGVVFLFSPNDPTWLEQDPWIAAQ